jgi:hypothetical protein
VGEKAVTLPLAGNLPSQTKTRYHCISVVIQSLSFNMRAMLLETFDMRNKIRFVMFGLLIAASMALAPAAFARGHVSIVLNFGFPGFGIGYYGGGYSAYAYAPAPVYYGPAYYAPAYYPASVYYGPSYYDYGPSYYGTVYYGPSYRGGYSYRGGGHYRPGPAPHSHGNGGSYRR